MNSKNIHNIQSVLIGGDLNCYSVARAFHEEYGVKSIAFGKTELGAVAGSKIIDYKIAPKIEDKDFFITTLRDLGQKLKNAGKIAILMGCSDVYVEMIIDNQKELEDLFIMPYMSKELKDTIINKEKFYELCEKHGFAYPKTKIYEYRSNLDDSGLMYPIILKPTDPIQFWQKRFDTMQKVYKVNNKEELKTAIENIYSNGYDANVIMQEYIPGDDSKIYTPTVYNDKNGKVKMFTFGHVLLEEHVPTARGNDAAILVEYNEEYARKLIKFLEDIGYVGFSNSDVKYDERDQQFKIFEVNIRQGRSNYHVSACGNNLARLIVEDYIENKDMELKIQKEPHFWSLVPDSVIKKHVPDKKLVKTAMELKKQGKYSSSYFYDFDLKNNFKRWFYITANFYNHIRKFNKYYNAHEMNKGL